MTCSTEAPLRKENDELRKLVVELGTIILALSGLEGRSLGALLNAEALRSPEETPPGEMILLLRQAAMHCAELSRASTDRRAGREFEGLSIKLADVAQRLNALYVDPGTIHRTIP